MDYPPNNSAMACAITIESAAIIAMTCCIPRMTKDEFLNLCESVWENEYQECYDLWEDNTENVPQFRKMDFEENLPAD